MGEARSLRRARTGSPAPAARREAPQTGAGLARLEGYLVWEAEVCAAERDAQQFAGQFRWLAQEQREEIAQAYTGDRLCYARGVFDRAFARAEEMGQDYASKCRRAAGLWAAVCLAAVAVTALLAAVPVLLDH